MVSLFCYRLRSWYCLGYWPRSIVTQSNRPRVNPKRAVKHLHNGVEVAVGALLFITIRLSECVHILHPETDFGDVNGA